MGNFYRCPRIWAARNRNSVPAFGDTLFGVQLDNDVSDIPELIKDGGATGDLWGDFGCAWHCPTCVEQLNRDPLTLASLWLKAVVADVAQAVPRIADTAVYVATARVLCAVCGVAAAKGGVVPGAASSSTSPARAIEASGLTTPCSSEAWKSTETPSVAPVYSDVLRLLEDAWRKSEDTRRCRPFLRLRSGRLLQLKFVVELCFGEVFAPAPHPARLSALAIRVLAALEARDAAALWAALQLLGDPEQRASIVGHSGDGTESGAACVMLQLQGYTAMLLHPLNPLEACGCSVEEALRRMTTATDALVATAPGEVCWLGVWQLVHCADRAFRHGCHHDSADGSVSNATNVTAMQTWAVRSVESAAVWRCGDPYAAIVAIFAVRTLILWRGLLLQQQEQSTAQGTKRGVRRSPSRSELLKSVERTLAGVSAHCAAATGAGGDAAAEARAVSMLLNDHHLAGAPQLAAQQPCLLHARKSFQDLENPIVSSSSLTSGHNDAAIRSRSKEVISLGSENARGSRDSVPLGYAGEEERAATRAAMGFTAASQASQASSSGSSSTLKGSAEATGSTALPADGAAFAALLAGIRPVSDSPTLDARPANAAAAAAPATSPTTNALDRTERATAPAAVADSQALDRPLENAGPDSHTIAAVVDAVCAEPVPFDQVPLRVVPREQRSAAFIESPPPTEDTDLTASPKPRFPQGGFSQAKSMTPPMEPLLPEKDKSHGGSRGPAAKIEGLDDLEMPPSDSAAMAMPASEPEAMPADGDVFERICSEIVAQNEGSLESDFPPV